MFGGYISIIVYVFLAFYLNHILKKVGSKKGDDIQLNELNQDDDHILNLTVSDLGLITVLRHYDGTKYVEFEYNDQVKKYITIKYVQNTIF